MPRIKDDPLNRRKSRIDWIEIKNDYLNSDKDLYSFSTEFTKRDNYPAWATLQKRASGEKWAELRAARNAQNIVRSEAAGKALKDVRHKSLEEYRIKLLDADATIQRHVEVASSLLSLGEDTIPDAHKAISNIDWQSLAIEDPRSFIGCLKDLTALMAVSIEIQRKAMGLTDYKIELATTRTNRLDVTARVEELRGKTDSEIITEYLEMVRRSDSEQ